MMADPEVGPSEKMRMVSGCANPACGTPFRFLHSGRIFRFDFAFKGPHAEGQDILWDSNGTAKRTEMFWLCERCAGEFTLVQNMETNNIEVQRLDADQAKAQGQ